MDFLKFYCDTISNIEKRLQNLNIALLERETIANYIIVPKFDLEQRKVIFKVFDREKNDSFFVIQTPTSCGVKFFDGDEGRLFEFFQKMYEDKKNTFLLYGDSHPEIDEYMNSKVGIVEKSVMNPDKKIFYPTQVRNNYVNDDNELVFWELCAIPEDEGKEIEESISKSINYRLNTNDLTDVDFNGYGYEKAISKMGAAFKIFSILNSTDIPKEIIALRHNFNRYLKRIKSSSNRAFNDNANEMGER